MMQRDAATARSAELRHSGHEHVRYARCFGI
jgi:hypothetical protein